MANSKGLYSNYKKDYLKENSCDSFLLLQDYNNLKDAFLFYCFKNSFSIICELYVCNLEYINIYLLSFNH